MHLGCLEVEPIWFAKDMNTGLSQVIKDNYTFSRLWNFIEVEDGETVENQDPMAEHVWLRYGLDISMVMSEGLWQAEDLIDSKEKDQELWK